MPTAKIIPVKVNSSASALPPLKLILNNPKPRANPIEIQIEAVVTALGHSFMIVSLDNARGQSRHGSGVELDHDVSSLFTWRPQMRLG